MSKDRIWLSSPHMGGDEMDFVLDAYRSNWVAPLGPNVNELEKDLALYTGVRSAAALSSGTAAIHLALIILGVKPEDEILVSSFTFSGSVNPIMYQRAIPIMVDSEPDTWNISPQYLEEAILDRIRIKGKAPKVLVMVHLYGMPAKVDEIKSICAKYGIRIIEDAAEALGSNYKGSKLGSFGDISVFSFNGNKIITTSGGGALLSNNEEWVEKARFLSTQARDSGVHYQHSEVGYNYRMSNILAGIGRGQLKVLDQWVQKRRTINRFYRDLLEEKNGIEFLLEPTADYFSNFWLTTITVDEVKTGFNREHLRTALLEDNIESRPLWKPMHLQPVFEDYPYYGDRLSENLFEHGLCLPSGSNMEEEQLERIKDRIISIFR